MKVIFCLQVCLAKCPKCLFSATDNGPNNRDEVKCATPSHLPFFENVSFIEKELLAQFNHERVGNIIGDALNGGSI